MSPHNARNMYSVHVHVDHHLSTPRLSRKKKWEKKKQAKKVYTYWRALCFCRIHNDMYNNIHIYM